MLKRIGDDGNLERVFCGVADGERNTVDRYRAFIDGEVAPTYHLTVSLIDKGEVAAAVSIFYGGAACCLVHVSLYDMAVKPSVHEHGTLHVHLVADFQKAEVRAVKCLLHGGDGVGLMIDG